MTKFYSIPSGAKCSYPDCKESAEAGWQNKLYCLFHYQIIRRARSNKIRKYKQEHQHE